MDFWHFFFKVTICLTFHPHHCHFGHFSFSMLFLNVARYTSVARRGTTDFTPLDMRFLKFLFCCDFKKFFWRKNGQNSSCWQCLREFFWLFSETLSFGRFVCFPSQKWNFEGTNFWSKTKQNHVFFHTNQFFEIVLL